MGFFNKHENEVSEIPLAQRLQEPKANQRIELLVTYFDNSFDIIEVTHNLEALQQLVSSAFTTGSSINFTSATPPFSLNPRWIRKVTYTVKGGDSM